MGMLEVLQERLEIPEIPRGRLEAPGRLMAHQGMLEMFQKRLEIPEIPRERLRNYHEIYKLYTCNISDFQYYCDCHNPHYHSRLLCYLENFVCSFWLDNFWK